MEEILTKQDIEEIEELAKVGLYPNEHEEYNRRVEQLMKDRRNLRWQQVLAPDLD